MHIVIPDHLPLSEEIKNKLEALGADIYDDNPSEVQLKERIKDAELITVNYFDATKEIIDAAPNLKYIVVPAVGYEWIDYKYARTKNIDVINCPTFNSHAVAEHAVGLMLATSRNFAYAQKSMTESRWESGKITGIELTGKKLGLIGYGNIGKRIEKLVSGFSMQVSYVNSKSSTEDLDTLLAQSDVVCVCAPLTESTKNLLSADKLNLLKQNTVFINVGRGEIVDQKALKDLASRGRLRLGLDVFTDEPLTGTPSNEIVEIANLSNAITTPHIGYNTEEATQRLSDELFANIDACLKGEPINVVNR
jgi:phosphoglycerate dehydrogenase-like enzyme